MSSSNSCFLSCTQVSEETGKVLFKNFPQFVVIHTIKGCVEKEIQMAKKYMTISLPSLITREIETKSPGIFYSDQIRINVNIWEYPTLARFYRQKDLFTSGNLVNENIHFIPPVKILNVLIGGHED